MGGGQKLDAPTHHHRLDNSGSKMTKLKLAGRIVDVSGDLEDPYFRAIAEVAEGFSALEAWGRASLPHNAVVIDAGGNIGITALLLSGLVPDGHVHVFEALPANARHLRRNLEANGVVNCTVNAVALGHQTGAIAMQGTGSSSHVMGEAATARNGTIPMTTLDDYVATAGLQRLDFIKMDVEGFEPAVLQGAAATIERFRPPILMEFNIWCLSFVQRFDARNFGYALWNAFDVLKIDGGGGERLAAEGDAYRFLHDNVVRHGSVEDILLRLRAGARVPAMGAIAPAPTSSEDRSEIDRLRMELAAMHRSTSWQATAPLRRLFQGG